MSNKTVDRAVKAPFVEKRHAMETAEKSKNQWRTRAVDEFKQLAVLTAFLFIVIASTNIMKAAVLHTYGVDTAVWGSAIVKAAVLAKFIALGKVLKIGERNSTSPLIWPTLYGAFAFFLFLAALTVIEETVIGLLHHRSIGVSLGDVFGMRRAETLSGMLILLLVLLPYFAFEVLAEKLGEGRLVKTFFVDRTA